MTQKNMMIMTPDCWQTRNMMATASWKARLILGILPIIPPRSNRKVPDHPDYRRDKDRNRVERMLGKLKQQRRIATRYDKTILSFESFLNLAAARLWLKSFVNTA